MLTERQERERQFFNQLVTSNLYANWQEFPYESWRVYCPIQTCSLDYLGDVRGKRLLLCGIGAEAVLFARAGAEVWGLDISEHQVDAVKALADRCGLGDQIHPEVMPFEMMSYDSAFFDVAWGNAILHHIDLKQGSAELRRVLKPGGRASFIEPLGMNPMLEFARKHLPYREKSRTVDERPLNLTDLSIFAEGFAHSEAREFTLLAMLQRRVITNKILVQQLHRMDAAILGSVPALRKFCSQVWVGLEAG